MNKLMPQWLYILLPFLYVVVGISVAVGMENKIALVAGLTLSNVGFLIIGLRHYIE